MRRAAILVTQYADLPLGTTDAIVMAMVESRNDPRVATLDARHFSIVKPDGFDRFVLLPDEAYRHRFPTPSLSAHPPTRADGHAGHRQAESRGGPFAEAPLTD